MSDHTPERIRPWHRLGNVFYGWWLVGVAAIIMAVGTVPLFQGMTTWFVVLEGAFGWNRTQLSLAFSLTRVEGSIMGPVGGYLIDKLGSRRMVLIGMLILGAGFMLFGSIQQLWHFYAAFIVMSIGAGLGTWMPMMTALNNWFRRRRATAMALAMEGFPVGSVVLIPILARAIDPDFPSRPGWRVAAIFIGIVIMALAFPMYRMVRNRPEDHGQHPDGQAPAPTAGNPAGARDEERGYTWQEALRTKNFWLITLGHACSSTVIVTVTVHLGPMLSDRGISLQMIGLIVSVYNAMGAVFNIVGGYVGDRVSVKIAIFGFSALQSAAVLVLMTANTVPLAFLFAVMFGMGFGGRGPLTTSIRGAYFGRRAFASITGISMIPMNVLFLFFPLFAGAMFDLKGSYTIPLLALAALSFFGSGLFLLLGEPSPAPARRSQVESRAGSP